jgi:ferredoxin-NADP reductase
VSGVLLHLQSTTDDVAVFTLRHPSRSHLPPAQAGNHVGVRLPDGSSRQYSLCGSSADRTLYKIAVKREDDRRASPAGFTKTSSRVDSARVHSPQQFSVGRCGSSLIARGIGITPFVAMAHAVARLRGTYELHYRAHSAGAPLIMKSAASALTAASKPTSRMRRVRRALMLHKTLAEAAEDTHVYCCGRTA